MNQINKKSLNKLVRRITKRTQIIRAPQLIHPTREWMIGLMSALCVIIAGSIWSTSLYLESRNQVTTESIATDEANEAVTYRATVVEEALTSYQARAQVFQNLVNANPTTNQSNENESTSAGDTATSTTENNTEEEISDAPILMSN